MNNLHLIDRLVVITDLAKEKADINWDFKMIEKIDNWEEKIIDYLEIQPNYFNVWDIVTYVAEPNRRLEVIEVWLTETAQDTWIAVTLQDLEDNTYYDDLEENLLLIKRAEKTQFNK